MRHATPDNMRHDGTRCGGCLVLLEAASPTHEHNELERSLEVVSSQVPRGTSHDPRGPRLAREKPRVWVDENFRNFMVLGC
ncbi:hypothetical protein GYH30_048070 [Glycine max]|nr:hypothetical protein GYH30_048070 [Glycine max]